MGINFGKEKFKISMSRNNYQDIRSYLRFYPQYSHGISVTNPLLNRRHMLENVGGNAATVSVLVGLISLDENTVFCKGRTGART